MNGLGTKELVCSTKTLTPKEETEYRVKNLCFFYHQKYSRDHRWPQREHFQLHYVGSSLSSEIVQGETEEGITEEVENDDEQPLI